MLSKDYAKKRAALINPEKANCTVPNGDPVGSNTTYLTVVDKDGNIASWIESVYDEFGSGLTAEGMGFIMQNRGALFTLDPKHPNVLAGGKRPFHTIIPAFMERGDLHIGFGIMGGANQPLAHAQFVSNIVDYGMNIQAALEAPRFTKTEFRRVRRVDRSPRARRYPAATFRARPRNPHPPRVHAGNGPRPGDPARLDAPGPTTRRPIRAPTVKRCRNRSSVKKFTPRVLPLNPACRSTPRRNRPVWHRPPCAWVRIREACG